MRALWLLLLFAPAVVAEDTVIDVRTTGIDGLSVPKAFARNTTLSVAGQEVFEHIGKGVRDLVAITPGVRQRSIDMLLERGYRDYCLPKFGIASRILFHRNALGLVWLIIGQQRTAHIVLANESPHLAHFHEEISALCDVDTALETE